MSFVNNLAYEASAGSGKTFMLVVRYLSLLYRGADPAKILALTFTNKAAAEMNERIIGTLQNLQNRGELDEIAKVTGLSRSELLAGKERVLHKFLNAHTKIMTIDSFFTQLLRKFSLYEGLMPDFTTYASQHEVKLMLRFLKEVSVAGAKPLLVSMALESKKRVGDIFKLLDEFYEKEAELSALVFERVYLAPLEEKVMGIAKELEAMVHASPAASSRAKSSIAVEKIEDLRKKGWLERDTLEYVTFKKCYKPQMDLLLRELQSSLCDYYRAKEQNFFYALKELLGLYKKAKKALYKEESELGFSDVTQLLFTILNHIDESEFLYFRIDATIEHMLLDEFQDTSIVQYKILRPLIREITAGAGVFEDGSFFFVGDVKQSIYRFRGGVSALFGVVAKENNTEVQKLRMNYRSKEQIVAFVNSVFENKIKNYTPQLSLKEAAGGYVAVESSDEPLEPTLQKVMMLLEMGAEGDDIAVLCATNADGELVKNALQQRGVAVVTETTTKLINQPSVQAVLEYLKYLYFEEDIYRHNFFALINQPLQPLKKRDVRAVELSCLVKDVVEQFGFGRDEFHLIRFMSELAHYKDIEALLFEYERLESSAAASDLSGVRVLTVHKSKGLEYKHVIVMDRLGKAAPSRESIIYEYEAIELQNIYLRTQGREMIDSAYAAALQKEANLAYEDRLNALYVAFTRAKESLFVVQKTKASSFALLELHNRSYGELFIKKEPKPPQKKQIPPAYEALYYGSQNDILALQKEQEEELEAISFGVAMHYMLEMMPSFSPEGIAAAATAMQNRYGLLLDKKSSDEIVSRVASLVAHKPFLELLEGAKIYKEKALRYKKNLRYLDLLLCKEDGSFIVVDYKSSLKHYQEHQKQVASYVRAVKAITKSSCVSGYLCYLLPEGVELREV